VDTLSINGDAAAPYSGAGAFSHGDIPAAGTPVAGATGDVTWMIGDVTNTGDNNGGNDDFEVRYRVQVQEVSDLPPSPTRISRTNTAAINYLLADGSTAPSATAADTIEVIQPAVVAGKTLRAGQPSLVAAGDTVRFRITVTNLGDGPAYNLALRDVLPVGLRSAVPVVEQATLNGVAFAIGAPTYDAASGALLWNLPDAAVVDPGGGTLVVDYDATVDTPVNEGLTLTNQSLVNAYYSKPSAEPDQRRQYMASPPAGVSVYTAGINWRPDNQQATQPNTTVTYPHRFDALLGGQTGTLSFAIDSSQSLGWAIYTDANGNDVLDAADPLWVNGSVVSSGSRGFFLKAHVPAGVPDGWVDTTTIQAGLTVAGQTISRTVTDVTRVTGTRTGKMTAVKTMALDTDCDGILSDESAADAAFEVNKQTSPGQCVVYRIAFSNDGTGALSDLRVEDAVPAFSTYVGASAAFLITPPGLTPDSITQPPNGGTGGIEWRYLTADTLNPGLSGAVTYEVKVDE
jgi:uncharacterized repeat protein (TIGR01451 family)